MSNNHDICCTLVASCCTLATIWIPVRFSNGFVRFHVLMKLNRLRDKHLNTGLKCPVFGWHLNFGPFHIRTHNHHLNTGLVRYSDGYCICIFYMTIFPFDWIIICLHSKTIYSGDLKTVGIWIFFIVFKWRSNTGPFGVRPLSTIQFLDPHSTDF